MILPANSKPVWNRRSGIVTPAGRGFAPILNPQPVMGVVGNIKTDLQAYYDLEEASGAARLDATANHYDLTDVNMVQQTAAGRVGNAAVFGNDGSDKYLFRGVSGELSFIGNFTFAFWLLRNDNLFGSQHPFCSAVAGSANIQMNFQDHPDDDLDVSPWYYGLRLSDPSNPRFRVPFQSTLNVWDFIVVFRNAAHAQYGMIVNNGLAYGISSSWTPDSSDSLFIGATNGGYPLAGPMDCIGYWDIPLNRAQITYLYNSGAGRSYAQL